MAVGVRHAGDDGSASFRIPGLATTNKGTLLGVYDVRYNNSADLQEYVDVGLSRSTDGGKSWEKMRLPLFVWRVCWFAQSTEWGRGSLYFSRCKNEYRLGGCRMDAWHG